MLHDSVTTHFTTVTRLMASSFLSRLSVSIVEVKVVSVAYRYYLGSSITNENMPEWVADHCGGIMSNLQV